MSNIKKDTRDVVLKTDGIDIIFRLKKNPYPQQAGIRIIVKSQSEANINVVASIEDVIERQELMELCDYLFNHVEKIKENPDVISHKYMDHTMLYILQALEGRWHEEDGFATFRLSFLVNVGRADSKMRIWMGSETLVDSRAISEFCYGTQE